MFKGLIAGLVAGVVGAAAWGALTFFTHREFGIVAWGIGLLVGFAVFKAMGAKASAASGVLAAVVALCTIAGGKFTAVYIEVDKAAQKVRGEVAHIGEGGAKIQLADQVVAEYQAAGKNVEFANGITSVEAAEKPEHYPKELWNDVESRWSSLSQRDRDERVKIVKASASAKLEAHIAKVREGAFLKSFDLFDALWAFLALGSAFRLGSGNK